ncbi:hypothetical protein MKY20_20590 [Cytobacillus sp. FSL W8-0315]|uniref:hypothetical protein n=1 Tax=Cytobacillus sp. FSL W8-0315 TaxID=2921600 RepID=UPI0030F8D9BC
MEFFRGKERLWIRKHEKYKGVCIYQGPDFSGYVLHVDEEGLFGGLDTFVSKIDSWLENGSWNETK